MDHRCGSFCAQPASNRPLQRPSRRA